MTVKGWFLLQLIFSFYYFYFFLSMKNDKNCYILYEKLFLFFTFLSKTGTVYAFVVPVVVPDDSSLVKTFVTSVALVAIVRHLVDLQHVGPQLTSCHFLKIEIKTNF